MRNIPDPVTWALAALLAWPGLAAADDSDQTQFESFVVAAGASNGAARACGASEPDLAEHQATARRNLQRYAQAYSLRADGYDALFRQGQGQGKAMMDEMKQSGVDGCRGVLGSFQHERAISYEDMKAALAEVSDGLPGEKAP